MTPRRSGDDPPTPDVDVSGGSIYHGGLHAGRDLTVGGDVEANASVVGAGEIDVTDALRAKVFDLLAKIAEEGIVGPQVDAAAAGLREEMKKPRTLRGRIETLLAAVEAHSGKIQLVDTAISVVRLALGP